MRQTLDDILVRGEKPTEEYLEEMRAIRSSELSDADLEAQALAVSPETELPSEIMDFDRKDPVFISKGPIQKTSESPLSILILIIIALAGAFGAAKFFGQI